MNKFLVASIMKNQGNYCENFSFDEKIDTLEDCSETRMNTEEVTLPKQEYNCNDLNKSIEDSTFNNNGHTNSLYNFVPFERISCDFSEENNQIDDNRCIQEFLKNCKEEQ